MAEPRTEEGDPSPSTPILGPVRRFGRYTLVKKLATGGMAEIWLARQRGLAGFNRFVVIKKILSHLSEQQTFIDMFLDEARMSAQLNHPNIVQIYDLGREGDSYYIAMEFIAGENLAALVWRGMKRNRPLPPQLAARVIADACKALHYAHHQKGADGKSLEIVHRDISPQNILVTYEGEVKVVDFGIAKAASKSEHTKTGMLKGKFSYMSPEQCQGESVDMRSDIFALGILLYELCTAKRLFKHDSELMILDMITKREISPPSQFAAGISPQLDGLIMKALEKRPEARFQTAQEMQIGLEDYLRDEDVPSSNADAAHYMRALFEDKIEEKRKLREEASRDDLENNFSGDEVTEGYDPAAHSGSGLRRRTVQGGTPTRNPAASGHSNPAYSQPPPSAGASSYPAASHGGQSQASYGQFNNAQSGYSHQYTNYPPNSVVGPNPAAGGLIAKLVIGGALVVIVVASVILYQQLARPEVAPAIVNSVTTHPAAPAKMGKVQLDSIPSGALIFNEDKPVMVDENTQAKTPSDLTLQYGTTYHFRLMKPGYDPQEQLIAMGSTIDKTKLAPHLVAKPSDLIVEVSGARATEVQIFVGGQLIGSGPSLSHRLEPAPDVAITARLSGMACTADPSHLRIEPDHTYRTTVRCETPREPRAPVERRARREGRIATGQPAPGPQTAELQAQAGPPGCKSNLALPPGAITISTKPFADIYIAGRKIGQTPLANFKLPSGCVEVKAVSASGKTVTKRLSVDPNTTNIYTFEVD